MNAAGCVYKQQHIESDPLLNKIKYGMFSLGTAVPVERNKVFFDVERVLQLTAGGNKGTTTLHLYQAFLFFETFLPLPSW